eukprot:425861-Rhodomonas_salina.1
METKLGREREREDERAGGRPALRRALQMQVSPCSHALCSGVQPSGVAAFTSAPASAIDHVSTAHRAENPEDQEGSATREEQLRQCLGASEVCVGTGHFAANMTKRGKGEEKSAGATSGRRFVHVQNIGVHPAYHAR